MAQPITELQAARVADRLFARFFDALALTPVMLASVAVARAIVSAFVSVWTLAVVLLAFRDSRHRGLHDLLARTAVVDRDLSRPSLPKP